jgi:hypothetical protein
MEQTWEPARRFVLAQSWWIASELVRRHPQLLALETHPGGGQYDCLSIVDSASRQDLPLIDINRVGRIHVPRAEAFEPITWASALGENHAHAVVRVVEAGAQLQPPTQAPPTTAKVLAYRVIARVLTTLVDDRHDWDVRSGYLQTFQLGSGTWPELSEFPGVAPFLDERRPDDVEGQPAFRFWFVKRGTESVAVLDTDSRLYLRDRPPIELLPIYKRTRSLTATIGETLSHLLP